MNELEKVTLDLDWETCGKSRYDKPRGFGGRISIDIVLALIVTKFRPLILLLAVGALFTSARTVDAQTARVSYGGTSGYNVPVWVTYDAGLFKKYGLNAEAIIISGDAPSMQAMLANETQFNNATGASSISAGLQGADPVIIATSYDRMPYAFVAHKDIASPADLKGKRIAITRFGGVTEFPVKIALEKFGLTPKDVSMIQGGPDAQRIPAVLSGAVAASVLAPPGLFAATAQGARILVDLGDSAAKYPTSTIIVIRPYLNQNRATVKSFLMAFVEGLHLYARDRDFTIAVMQEYTKLKDPSVLSKSHDYFVKRTAVVPLTDPTAIKNALPESDRPKARGSGSNPLGRKANQRTSPKRLFFWLPQWHLS